MKIRNHRLAQLAFILAIELTRLAEKVIDFLSMTSNYCEPHALKMDFSLRT